jgi:hypothetical protein
VAAARDLGGCRTPELGEEGEGRGCSISLAHSLKFFDAKQALDVIRLISIEVPSR